MARKDKFNYFKAYEKQSEIALEEAEILLNSVQAFTSADKLVGPMEKLHKLENEGDEINHDIFASAAVDFMPPIDREDVVELAHALDNVLDYIEDVVRHMYMYDIHIMREDAVQFAGLIKKSCKALNAMTCEFQNFKKNKKFKQLVVDINSYEEEADVLYTKAIRNLHTKSNGDAMHVLVWSRIYDRMEKCCDATEHAADIVSTIVLKNI